MIKTEGMIIIVMQQIHENDLCGYLLETNNELVHLNFPAIAPHDEKWEDLKRRRDDVELKEK